MCVCVFFFFFFSGGGGERAGAGGGAHHSLVFQWFRSTDLLLLNLIPHPWKMYVIESSIL